MKRNHIIEGQKIYFKNDTLHLIALAATILQGHEQLSPEDPNLIINKSKSESVKSTIDIYNWLCFKYNIEQNIDPKKNTLKELALKTLDLLTYDYLAESPSQEGIDKVFNLLQSVEQIDILKSAYQKAERKSQDNLQTLKEYVTLSALKGLVLKP